MRKVVNSEKGVKPENNKEKKIGKRKLFRACASFSRSVERGAPARAVE